MKINYLHIGKTAGTSFRVSVQSNKKLNEIIVYNSHKLRMPDVVKGKVLFAVRDPLSRFVSAFYHRQKKLRRHREEGMDSTWYSNEIKSLDKYPDINMLLSDLFSENRKRNLSAKRAISNIMHLGIYGSYWYWFKSGKYLKSNIDRIYQVIRQENFNSDMILLAEKLDAVPIEIAQTRVGDKKINPVESTYFERLLSYLKKEYEFIEILQEHQLLSKDYLKERCQESRRHSLDFYHSELQGNSKLRRVKHFFSKVWQ